MKLLREVESPSKVVGSISERHGVVWTVRQHRKDRRTGPTRCIPMSDYWQEMREKVSIR